MWDERANNRTADDPTVRFQLSVESDRYELKV